MRARTGLTHKRVRHRRRGVLASLALFFYTRRSDRDPRPCWIWASDTLVFTAFGIGLSWRWQTFPKTGGPAAHYLGGRRRLDLPAIVPCTPLKTLVAGLVAAADGPLGCCSRGLKECGISDPRAMCS
jgi:hypothetical protein